MLFSQSLDGNQRLCVPHTADHRGDLFPRGKHRSEKPDGKMMGSELHIQCRGPDGI